jgi:hypothetical protein
MNREQKLYRLIPAQKEEVVETIKKVLSTRSEVKFAFLFGSFYDESIEKEDRLPFHDIDVGIFLQGITKKQSVYYALELADQLSCLIHIQVDVRVLNFAPITFLFHVIQGRLIDDKDEDARCAFMEWVVRHYLDMKPLLHRAVKEAFGQ